MYTKYEPENLEEGRNSGHVRNKEKNKMYFSFLIYFNNL